VSRGPARPVARPQTRLDVPSRGVPFPETLRPVALAPVDSVDALTLVEASLAAPAHTAGPRVVEPRYQPLEPTPTNESSASAAPQDAMASRNAAVITVRRLHRIADKVGERLLLQPAITVRSARLARPLHTLLNQKSSNACRACRTSPDRRVCPRFGTRRPSFLPKTVSSSNGQKIDTRGSGVPPIFECQIASYDMPPSVERFENLSLRSVQIRAHDRVRTRSGLLAH
jgi:hypothetical protein